MGTKKAEKETAHTCDEIEKKLVDLMENDVLGMVSQDVSHAVKIITLEDGRRAQLQMKLTTDEDDWMEL